MMIFDDSHPVTKAPELCRLNAAELSAHYASGAISPVEVARQAISWAAQMQAAWNAFSFIDGEGALVAARASEARWRKGRPLSESDGIPTTIKDIVWVDNWVVRFGSRTTAQTPMRADAPSVARLRQAGAVFIAQTTSPEFGWKPVTDSPLRGTTRNPWDWTKTPGGSSGGAAVAAASGAGVFHLGTDGGGSIRIPASFTGTVGHKPTFGRVPNFPPSGFYTVSHTGPLTRCVDDAARMLRAMEGRDLRDWSQGVGTMRDATLSGLDLGTLRIGYWSEPPAGSLDPEVRCAIDGAVAALGGAGSAIEPFELPADDIVGLFDLHWLSGAALRFSLLSETDKALVDPGFRDAAEQGARLTATALLGAQVKRAHFGAAMDRRLAEIDVIVSPATPCCAFEVGHDVPPGSGATSWTEWTGFSSPLNLSGHPACVIPCGSNKAGLPIGLQIIGPRGADDTVLSLARAIEDVVMKARPPRSKGFGLRG